MMQHTLRTSAQSGVILGISALILGWGAVASANEYKPVITPSEFSSTITNPFFSLPVGSEFEYEGKTEDGTETIEAVVTGETKKVMGVTTLVFREREWLDGELVEDTRDYLAQDAQGNVWYFGEDVDNYEDGKVVDHDGSWLAGKGGAQPGIWMPGSPTVGMVYRQEYLKGEAEDMGEVLSLTERVKVPFGTFTNCLKTKDTTPLEPDVLEHKYYCKGGANTLVLEVNVEDGDRVELVERELEDDGDDEEGDEDEDEEGDDEDEDDEEDDEGDEDEESAGSEITVLQTRLISLLRELIALLSQK